MDSHLQNWQLRKWTPFLDRFASGISGRAVVREIAGAGHLAELDQPDAVAAAVREFLE